jgi:hypothetical protein
MTIWVEKEEITDDPHETPDETPDETSDETLDETLDETPDETPDASKGDYRKLSIVYARFTARKHFTNSLCMRVYSGSSSVLITGSSAFRFA